MFRAAPTSKRVELPRVSDLGEGKFLVPGEGVLCDFCRNSRGVNHCRYGRSRKGSLVELLRYTSGIEACTHFHQKPTHEGLLF
jgi:hypothetical protein